MTLTQADQRTHYYKFHTTDRDSSYKLRLEYTGGNIQQGVTIGIFSADDADYIISTWTNSLSTSDAVLLKPDTDYYINIATNEGLWNGINENEYVKYSFRVIEEITTPKISYVEPKASGKRAMKVKWGKHDYADRYEVQYSVSGANSWSKTKKTTKTSMKIKGLKRNTWYDFRVRGVRMVDGKAYRGEWTQAGGQTK